MSNTININKPFEIVEWKRIRTALSRHSVCTTPGVLVELLHSDGTFTTGIVDEAGWARLKEAELRYSVAAANAETLVAPKTADPTDDKPDPTCPQCNTELGQLEPMGSDESTVGCRECGWNENVPTGEPTNTPPTDTDKDNAADEHIELVTSMVDALGDAYVEVMDREIHDDDAWELADQLVSIGVTRGNRAALVGWVASWYGSDAGPIIDLMLDAAFPDSAVPDPVAVMAEVLQEVVTARTCYAMSDENATELADDLVEIVGGPYVVEVKRNQAIACIIRGGVWSMATAETIWAGLLATRIERDNGPPTADGPDGTDLQQLADILVGLYADASASWSRARSEKSKMARRELRNKLGTAYELVLKLQGKGGI